MMGMVPAIEAGAALRQARGLAVGIAAALVLAGLVSALVLAELALEASVVEATELELEGGRV